MKADELWDKYAAHRGNGYPTMDKPDFLAALTEYGEHVKAEAVKVCKSQQTCGVWETENLHNPRVTGWREHTTVNDCAAAIEKMPLP